MHTLDACLYSLCNTCDGRRRVSAIPLLTDLTEHAFSSAFTDMDEEAGSKQKSVPFLPSTDRKELVCSKGLTGDHPVPIIPFTIIENIG